LSNYHVQFALIVKSDVKPQNVSRDLLKSVMRLNYDIYEFLQ